jgi:cytochrome c
VAAALLSSASAVYAAGDATKGAAIFQQCQMCHTAEKGVNKVGPSLYGVVGRPAGSIASFDYSDAMKAASAKGLVWSEDQIVKYLANPHEFFVEYLGDKHARNKMTFFLTNEQDRQDVIAYLKTVPK